MYKNLIILGLLGVIAGLVSYVLGISPDSGEGISQRVSSGIEQSARISTSIDASVKTDAEPAAKPPTTAVATVGEALPDTETVQSPEPAATAAVATSEPPIQHYIPPPRPVRVIPPAMSEPERERLMAEHQQAVANLRPLIEEFNANLSDRDARQRIQAQISENAPVFKETALKLAKDQLARDAATR